MLQSWLPPLCSYEAGDKLEPFYSGGGVTVSQDGQYLFSSCGSTVKMVAMDTGQTTLSMSEVRSCDRHVRFGYVVIV